MYDLWAKMLGPWEGTIQYDEEGGQIQSFSAGTDPSLTAVQQDYVVVTIGDVEYDSLYDAAIVTMEFNTEVLLQEGDVDILNGEILSGAFPTQPNTVWTFKITVPDPDAQTLIALENCRIQEFGTPAGPYFIAAHYPHKQSAIFKLADLRTFEDTKTYQPITADGAFMVPMPPNIVARSITVVETVIESGLAEHAVSDVTQREQLDGSVASELWILTKGVTRGYVTYTVTDNVSPAQTYTFYFEKPHQRDRNAFL